MDLLPIVMGKRRITDSELQQVVKQLAETPFKAGTDWETRVMRLLTGGETEIGAQRYSTVGPLLADILAYSKNQLESAKTELTAINPSLNPVNYYTPSAEAYPPPEGQSNSQNAALKQTYLKVYEMEQAIKKAQEAAKTYQQTGVVPTFDKRQGLAETGYFPIGSNVETETLAKNAIDKTATSMGGITMMTPDEAAAQWRGVASKATPMQGVPSQPGGTAGAEAESKGISQPPSGAANQATNNEDLAAGMKVLDDAFNNGEIDFGTYDFYKTSLEEWTPGNDVNYAKILSTWNDIVKKDIDPAFLEQARLGADDISRSIENLKSEKALSETALTAETKAAKEAAQKDLNARGMTFTGEGIKTLGAESAFAQAGTPQAAQSAIPVQQPGFGGQFEQGTINQASQTAVNTANLRYQQQLTDIARNAEKALGTTAATALGTGVTSLGGITGSLEEQKMSAKGTALGNVYQQELQNVEAKKPVDLIK